MGGFLALETAKFQLLIEVFARFFRVLMRGWFFSVLTNPQFLQVLIIGVQNKRVLV